MKAQEIIDFVALKLFMQKEASRVEYDCLYRSADGKKCAVGWLIPDELYKPEFDDWSLLGKADYSDTSVDTLLNRVKRLEKYILPDDLDYNKSRQFVASLQNVHDTLHGSLFTPYTFDALAEKWGLRKPSEKILGTVTFEQLA